MKASNGWLENFKKSYNIVWNSINGEANDVDMTIVGEWKEKIEDRVENHEPKDVYNCDETGLFYHALPSRTLAVKGDRYIGRKLSIERLMVLGCGNMEGELEKLLVIGKAAKPRCFKNLKISSLLVRWKSSRKA